MNELLNYLEDEKAIVEELIEIDNDIMKTNYSYDNYYSEFQNVLNKEVNSILIDKDTIFVTEGDVFVTLDILRRINSLNKIVVYINQGYVGMNKWLISKYYDTTGNDNVVLDVSINYNKYIDKGYRVIPLGEESLVEQVMEDFYDKE